MKSLQSLDPTRFETTPILKQLNAASRSLAELKGVIASIPHQGILINTLGIQEAKDSSAIENIVTTHDELYREEAFPDSVSSAAAKEVYRYRQALGVGFQSVEKTGLITVNHLCDVQAELIGSQAGIRTMPGTTLKNAQGQIVYTPPQDHEEILSALGDLATFINDPTTFAADPLIKMADPSSVREHPSVLRRQWANGPDSECSLPSQGIPSKHSGPLSQPPANAVEG